MSTHPDCQDRRIPHGFHTLGGPGGGKSGSTCDGQPTITQKYGSSLAEVNADKHCGGISLNSKPPKCCEVHLLPWGHEPIQP